eukprot:1159437-Pelagomonas_calceolata.AAC.6
MEQRPSAPMVTTTSPCGVKYTNKFRSIAESMPSSAEHLKIMRKVTMVQRLSANTVTIAPTCRVRHTCTNTSKHCMRHTIHPVQCTQSDETGGHGVATLCQNHCQHQHAV